MTVQGASELDAKFRRLATSGATRLGRDGTLAGLIALRRSIRRAAPETPHGSLRRSVGYSLTGSAGEVGVNLPGGVGGEQIPHAYYYVAGTAQQPARDFVSVGMENGLADAAAAIAAATGRALLQEARR